MPIDHDVMKQGESDFNRGFKKADNPHLDCESRAAWFEGWLGVLITPKTSPNIK